METVRGGIPNVLVVDDERVYEAGNAQEALEALEEARMDVALLDNQLPGEMSGLELREIVMGRVPVIMVTGADILPGVPEGDMLMKPFDLSVMIAMVSRRVCPTDG